jgi:hypothetical protein
MEGHQSGCTPSPPAIVASGFQYLRRDPFGQRPGGAIDEDHVRPPGVSAANALLDRGKADEWGPDRHRRRASCCPGHGRDDFRDHHRYIGSIRDVLKVISRS